MIFGICGKKGSGKDYYAKNILFPKLNINEPTIILGFADFLKLYALSENLFTFDELFIEKSEKSRNWMQYYGTDVKRIMDPTYWIKIMENTIKIHQERGIKNFIITDVRFLNEIDWIHKKNGKIYKIINENMINNDTHISENELNNFVDFDVIIINNF